MVSRFRMRFDFLGQAIMLCAFGLLFFFSTGRGWTNFMLGFLIFWQLASAVHLLLAYKHVKRMNFVRTSAVLLISLPIWFKLIGTMAYLPVAGLILWAFYQTVRDMIIVNNRPRSFWDLT